MKNILPFASAQVNFESIRLHEISQTEKDKYSMVSFICGSKKTKLIEMETRVVFTTGCKK